MRGAALQDAGAGAALERSPAYGRDAGEPA